MDVVFHPSREGCRISSINRSMACAALPCPALRGLDQDQASRVWLLPKSNRFASSASPAHRVQGRSYRGGPGEGLWAALRGGSPGGFLWRPGGVLGPLGGWGVLGLWDLLGRPWIVLGRPGGRLGALLWVGLFLGVSWGALEGSRGLLGGSWGWSWEGPEGFLGGALNHEPSWARFGAI